MPCTDLSHRLKSEFGLDAGSRTSVDWQRQARSVSAWVESFRKFQGRGHTDSTTANENYSIDKFGHNISVVNTSVSVTRSLVKQCFSSVSCVLFAGGTSRRHLAQDLGCRRKVGYDHYDPTDQRDCLTIHIADFYVDCFTIEHKNVWKHSCNWFYSFCDWGLSWLTEQ